MIKFNANGHIYVWHGGHTVNIYRNGTEVDVFTLFPADGRKPSQLEISDAIARRGDHIGLGSRLPIGKG